MNTAKMTEIGGKVWQAGAHHRVYFNLTEEIVAQLNVEMAAHKPFNRKDRDCLNCLTGGDRMTKFWYDVNTNEFHAELVTETVFLALEKSITEYCK